MSELAEDSQALRAAAILGWPGDRPALKKARPTRHWPPRRSSLYCCISSQRSPRSIICLTSGLSGATAFAECGVSAIRPAARISGNRCVDPALANLDLPMSKCSVGERQKQLFYVQRGERGTQPLGKRPPHLANLVMLKHNLGDFPCPRCNSSSCRKLPRYWLHNAERDRFAC